MLKSLLFILFFVFELYASKTFTIANYNVENLFDLHQDGTEYSEYLPNTSFGWNQEHYQAKLAHAAQVLHDLNADIVALEEVENQKVLLELQKLVPDYRYWAITHTSGSAVQVALLSKLPILFSKEHTVSQSPKFRPILEVGIDVYGKPLRLYVNHWKAKNGPESERIVYAKTLKTILQTLGAQTEYLLLGDFNSNYNEFETFQKERKLNNTHGQTGINHLLRTIRGQTFTNLATLQRFEHYNLWLDSPEDQRFSHLYKHQKGTLDNMLVPHSLADNKNIDYMPHTFRVFKPPYLYKKGRIMRWQMKNNRHTGKGYSDHLPIYATFKVLP